MERAPEHRPQKLSVAAGVGGGGGEDRLSALPDDVLVHILLKLCDTALAARTSVLARRWRRVWALLPELHFPVGTGPDRIRAALTAHDAPAFRHLFVAAIEVTPESAASWLPIAARRLSGVLHFKNRGDMNEASAGERGALQLPCFEKATKVVLDLRSIGLTLPPSGEFTRLTDLELVHIQLHGPCSLSDVVSSPRCPSLLRLSVRSVRSGQAHNPVAISPTVETERSAYLAAAQYCCLVSAKTKSKTLLHRCSESKSTSCSHLSPSAGGTRLDECL
ncbi:putative F-box/FBD/LRR-repeat protein At3g49030 [Triticum urartu]|uniref:putative F-box/FBD/LRR-repeat protein At3g49030 n=1 Tax=Triticum urartu TaxID=4572 RepID=UPI0020446F01|nr:putative F-box/FBD/LRR-repeat protein At3g49030 [Triticum urartu]